MTKLKTTSRLTEIIQNTPHCLAAFRHGQTSWNVEDRLTTTTDIPLTEFGRTQPEALPVALKPIRFDFISASPLQRAFHTAEIACSKMSEAPPIIPDDRLIEPAGGIFEGIVFDELYNGEMSEAFHSYQDETNPITPEGGEDIKDSVIKANALLDQAAANPGRHLMFSHGAFLRIMACVSMGGNPNCYRRLKLDNCCGIIVKFYPNPPNQLLALNISA